MAIGVALMLVGVTHASSGGHGDEQEKIIDLSERWRAAVSNRDPALSELVSSASENHYRKLRQLALYGEADALQDLHPTDQLQALFFRTMLDSTELQAMSPREVIAFAVETGMIGVDLRKNDELREIIVFGKTAQGRLYKFGRDDRADRGLQYFEYEEGVWRIDLKSELERLRKDFSAFVTRSNLAPDEAAFFILETRLLRKVTPADFMPPASGSGTEKSDVSVSQAQAGGDFLRVVAIRESLDDPHENAATIEDRQESLRSVLSVGDFFGDENGHRLVRVADDRAWLERDGGSLVLRLEPEGPPLDQRVRVDGASTATLSLLKQARLGQYREGLMAQWRNVGLRARPQLLQQGWLVPEFAPGHETMLGLRVRKLVEGSFWHQLGLAEGDLLERVNGGPIDSMDRWQELLRAAETDQEISVVVLRDGQKRRFHLKTVPPRGSRK